MQKDFDTWNKTKKTVHEKEVSSYFHSREIWWCSLGLNIGSEEDGKNELFERPILILNKFNKDTVRITPLTSRIIDDKNHVTINFDNYQSSAKLSQVKTISTKRLTRKLSILDDEQFKKVLSRLVEHILQDETAP